MCNIFRLINVEQKLFRSQKYRRKDFRLDFNENLKILPGLFILVDGIDTYVHCFILCSMLVQLSSLATLYHKILLLREKRGPNICQDSLICLIKRYKCQFEVFAALIMALEKF